MKTAMAQGTTISTMVVVENPEEPFLEPPLFWCRGSVYFSGKNFATLNKFVHQKKGGGLFFSRVFVWAKFVTLNKFVHQKKKGGVVFPPKDLLTIHLWIRAIKISFLSLIYKIGSIFHNVPTTGMMGHACESYYHDDNNSHFYFPYLVVVRT